MSSRRCSMTMAAAAVGPIPEKKIKNSKKAIYYPRDYICTETGFRASPSRLHLRMHRLNDPKNRHVFVR